MADAIAAAAAALESIATRGVVYEGELEGLRSLAVALLEEQERRTSLLNRLATPENILAVEILNELSRARAKFPGDNVTTLALVEEVGELAKATFEESRARVREEAVQVATMAMRVVLDGDQTLNDWRQRKGLDALRAAHSADESNGEQKRIGNGRYALDLLTELVDPDPCRFDHHGGCQAHATGREDYTCPHADAKTLLAALGLTAEETE